MAGMLPGVELARRRRTSHHFFDSNSRDSFRHQRLETATTMDETAVKARRRLEEKLRGFAPSRGSSKPKTSNNNNYNNDNNNNNESRRPRPAKEAESGGIDTEKVVRRRSKQLERRNSQRDVCSICLEEFGGQQQVMNLPCFHRYHSDCLLPWLNAHSHCPYCRTNVKT